MTVLADTPIVGFSPLRFALRELRAGVHGFRIFIACLALGVMAIAGVGSLSRSLTDGLNREGRTILGGDLSFALMHREATSAEQRFLTSKGTVSTSATLRSMARTPDGKQALVELKAVDGLYPLYGTIKLEPTMPLSQVTAMHSGVYGAAVEPTLLTRLGVKAGDRVTIGSATFEIKAAIQTEPDKLATGLAFGPRIIVSEDALRATGLLVPGSLVRWAYRLRLPDGSDELAKAVTAAANAQLPDAGWQVSRPHQRHAGAGTQRRSLLPVSHAGWPDRAAGRRSSASPTR